VESESRRDGGREEVGERGWQAGRGESKKTTVLTKCPVREHINKRRRSSLGV